MYRQTKQVHSNFTSSAKLAVESKSDRVVVSPPLVVSAPVVVSPSVSSSLLESSLKSRVQKSVMFSKYGR